MGGAAELNLTLPLSVPMCISVFLVLISDSLFSERGRQGSMV